MRQSRPVLVESILDFIADPASGDFSALARRAGAADRADPRLRRAAVAAVLAAGSVTVSARQPVLALDRPAADGGGRLADDLLEIVGDDASLRPTKPRGVDPVAVRSWLAARQRDRRPALLVGAESALAGLLAPIERRGLRFRLPAGSAALVRREEDAAPDDALRARLVDRLGVAAGRLWLAWRPLGAATPLLARWDGANRFAIPHWVRVEVAEDGRLVVTDLAGTGREPRTPTGARGTVAGDRLALS